MEQTHVRYRLAIEVMARHGSRVLLVRSQGRNGFGSIQGAPIVEEETPLEAAWRELWEKTGLFGRIDSASGTGVIGYRETPSGPNECEIRLTFVSHVSSVEKMTLAEEIAEVRWVASPAEADDSEGLRDLVRLALDSGRPSFLALARNWLAAVNAHDPERLADLYAEDGSHSTPELSATGFQSRALIRGKADLTAWWSEFLSAVPGLQYEERSASVGAEHVMLECLRDYAEVRVPFAVRLVFSGSLLQSSYVYRS